MEPEDLQPDGRLGELLRAAAAPGRPHELAGEDAAVAAFSRVYRPARRLRRRLAAGGVAVLAAVSIGGTAFAAGTGHLPAPVQEWIDGGHHPSAADASSPVATAGPRTTPPPRPATPGPTSAAPTSAALADSCRAFLAFRSDPHARPLTGGERRDLARAAGGEPQIEDYCRRLLGITAPASDAGNDRKPSHPAHPSHP
jgi:hypothetical protein